MNAPLFTTLLSPTDPAIDADPQETAEWRAGFVSLLQS
jgi:hypothetical protein